MRKFCSVFLCLLIIVSLLCPMTAFALVDAGGADGAGTPDPVEQGVTTIVGVVAKIWQSIFDYLPNIFNNVNGIFVKLRTALGDYNIGKAINDIFTKLRDSIGDYSIGSIINDIKLKLNNAFGEFSFAQTINDLKLMWRNTFGDFELGTNLSNIWKNLRDSKIGSTVESIKESLTNIELPSLGEMFSGVSSSIGSLGDKLSPAGWIKDLRSLIADSYITHIFHELRSWLSNLFASETSVISDGNNPGFWDFVLGLDEENNLFTVISDNVFMAGLINFYAFVQTLWFSFDITLRYFLLFGFGAPMVFGVFNLLAR